MNTETIQDQALTTTGGLLRRARENMGFTQQEVANRLFLKVSTVRDIEDDNVNPNIAATFLRGYIRSYARLVHISEEELMPMIAKQVPIKSYKVSPIQQCSLGTICKKRDNLMMGFTWLILLIVVSLTLAWWWENHQFTKQDIVKIDQPSLEKDVNTLSTSAQYATKIDQSAPHISETGKSMPASMNVSAEDSNVLVMYFTGDCWIEVFDAGGKKLIDGTQHSGTTLHLTGQAPYKVQIEKPAYVQVKYEGKLIDLSRFILSNQVARLNIASQ